MVKNRLVYILLLSVVILQGCNSLNEENSKGKVFSTFEEAVDYYGEKAGENLVLVETIKGDFLLLTEAHGDYFSVGEIQETDEQYVARKLTASFDISTVRGNTEAKAIIELNMPDSNTNYFVALGTDHIETFLPFSDNRTFEVFGEKDIEHASSVVQSYKKLK
ncbi:hypothetical protein [Halobacillus ihumii]|uniref:hypothetical protein n=1 Tax=Halobacillus ihumii TaxID=2686092 RepID=UPI0013D7EAD9|nr:hypothetical protein [Halobacillus ihumii]